MSYILDALRRAQAERGRGGVPGLHTPAVTSASTASAPAQQGSSHRGAWLIAGVAVAAAAVLAWLQFGAKSSPQPAVVLASAPTPPPAPIKPPEPAPETTTTPEPVKTPAQSAPNLSENAAKPIVLDATPAPVVLDVTPPPPPPPPPPAPLKPAAPKSAVAPAPVPPAAPPASPAPAAAPAAPVYNMANLPPAVREQLPNLQLAGITYSSNPKYRMVIVNGQVLHEGDSAGPGLVLDRIETARTIWSFKGYRYALP